MDFLAILPLQVMDNDWFAMKLFRIFHIQGCIALFDFSKVYGVLSSAKTEGSRDEYVETRYWLIYVYKISRLLLIAFILTYFLGVTMLIISKKAYII